MGKTCTVCEDKQMAVITRETVHYEMQCDTLDWILEHKENSSGQIVKLEPSGL